MEGNFALTHNLGEKIKNAAAELTPDAAQTLIVTALAQRLQRSAFNPENSPLFDFVVDNMLNYCPVRTLSELLFKRTKAAQSVPKIAS